MKVEFVHGGGLPEMGAFIGHAIASMPPNNAQAQMGAIFANIVGNIPAKKWEQMREAANLPCECGDPRCADSIKAFFVAGDVARAQFDRNAPKPP